MINLLHIYRGWKNYFFRKPEIEILAEKRTKICKACDHFSKLQICTKCKCPRAGKVRSPDSFCPEGKWLDYYSEQELLPVNQDNTPDVPMNSFKTSDELIEYLKN